MEAKHTQGQWRITRLAPVLNSRAIVVKGDKLKLICAFTNIRGDSYEKMTEQEIEANIKLCAAAPELLQMVKDLKDCIKRLTSDDALTQFDKDRESEWEGEAHELLCKINPNYYKNANEK